MANSQVPLQLSQSLRRQSGRGYSLRGDNCIAHKVRLHRVGVIVFYTITCFRPEKHRKKYCIMSFFIILMSFPTVSYLH